MLPFKELKSHEVLLHIKRYFLGVCDTLSCTLPVSECDDLRRIFGTGGDERSEQFGVLNNDFFFVF